MGVIGGPGSLTTGALVLDYPRAVPPLLLIEAVGFPLAVIALVAVLWRLSWRRYDRNPLNRRVEGVPVGSAAVLVDAGSIPWPNMLDVLTVVRVDGDAERTADHPTAGDNPFAEVLGLRSPYTTKQEPNLMYGERHGHQVFIRMGIDETRRSGLTRRHMREITVVRAETPVFELRGEGGTLSFEPGAPAGIRAVVEPLAPAPGVWDELRVVGGAAGIVATRPLEGRWLYDLWLLERMAASLAAPALPPARLGPSFKVPTASAASDRARKGATPRITACMLVADPRCQCCNSPEVLDAWTSYLAALEGGLASRHRPADSRQANT